MSMGAAVGAVHALVIPREDLEESAGYAHLEEGAVIYVPSAPGSSEVGYVPHVIPSLRPMNRFIRILEGVL